MPFKIADVPDPPVLTDEDLARIRKESEQMRRMVHAATAGMEPTAEDMRIVVGGPGCLCRRRR